MDEITTKQLKSCLDLVGIDISYEDCDHILDVVESLMGDRNHLLNTLLEINKRVKNEKEYDVYEVNSEYHKFKYDIT